MIMLITNFVLSTHQERWEPRTEIRKETNEINAPIGNHSFNHSLDSYAKQLKKIGTFKLIQLREV